MESRPRIKNAIVVYNPKAGSAERVHRQMTRIQTFLTSHLGYSVKLLTFDCPKSEFSLKEEIEDLENLELVVAAGGDGTVGGVLEATARVDPTIPVAIIPIGTGNLLARTLGVYPMKMHGSLIKYAADLYWTKKHSDDVIDYALNIIGHGVFVPIDLATANNDFMAIGAGTGPLAEAIARPCSKEKKSLGMLVYMISMLRLITRNHRTFLVKIDDEEPFEAEAMGVFVSNLPNLGIGTPEDLDQVRDGLLDLFVVDCNGPMDFVKVWWRFLAWLFSNKRVPPYLVRRVSRVRATVLATPTTPSIAKPKLSVDGDPGGQGPLDVHVSPLSATVCVPEWIANHLRKMEEPFHQVTGPID